MEMTSEKSVLIQRYLLNELPESDRLAFEARYFEDTAFFLDVLSIKDALIQRYLQGLLSQDETQRFEREFLSVEALRKEVEFAAMARGFLTATSPAPQPPAPARPWWAFWLPGTPDGGLGPWRLAPVALLALVTLAGVAGLAWYSSLRRPAQSTASRASVSAAAYPARIDLSPSDPLRDSAAPPGRVIPLPPPDAQSTLKLQLRGKIYPMYRGDLLRPTEGNRVVASQESLKLETDGQESFVLWKLEPAKMSTGDYRLELQGIPERGEKVSVSGYDLRVR